MTERRLLRILREPVWLGLAGVLSLFVLVALWQALILPPYKPLDEPRHAAYSIVLGEGRLPKMGDELPSEAMEMKPLKRANTVMSANHPPLYYAIVAAPLLIGSKTHHMAAGIKAARIVTLLMAAAGLVFIFRALRQLTPRRPALALAATAFTASIPAYVNCSSVVMNDALAFLTSAAVYDAGLAILLRGPDRRRWIYFYVWLALASLSRFTTLLAVAPAVLAVCLAVLLHDPAQLAKRLLRATLAGLAAIAVVAVTSGYFYLRNYRLYGDLTGGKAIFELLSRKKHAPFSEQVVDIERWFDLSDQMWSRLAGSVSLQGFNWAGRGFFFVAGIGALKLAYDQRARLRSLDWRSPRVIASAVLALGLACVIFPIFEYTARGGGFHARYCFTMVWVAWMFVAVGLAGFRSSTVLTGGVALASIMGLIVNNTYLGKIAGTRGSDFGLYRGFAKAEMPWPEASAAVMLALFCFALVVVVHQLWVLDRPAASVGGDGQAPPPS
jgi:hypothetical protein